MKHLYTYLMSYDFMDSYKNINLGAVHTAILSSILGDRLSRSRSRRRTRRTSFRDDRSVTRDGPRTHVEFYDPF